MSTCDRVVFLSSHASSSSEGPNFPERREDLYFILGVSVGASREVVRRAYKRMAKLHHPDVSPESADKFLQIKAAYDALQSERGTNLQDVQSSEWRLNWKRQLNKLKWERAEKLRRAGDDGDDDSDEIGGDSLVGTVAMTEQISAQLRNLKARTHRKRTRKSALQKSAFREPFVGEGEEGWNHEVQ